MDTIYYRQTRLLLKLLPLVGTEKVFALKGGTAINFFIRDLPRLSVDIDLAYIPVSDRNEALKDIRKSLNAVALKILKMFPKARIAKKRINDTGNLKGMIINADEASVKIEPNIVMRGTVYEPEIMELSQTARDMFEMHVAVNSLSFAEVYAGKICAVLDRQHPRDLFDIHMLLANEGIDEKILKAFLVYLISHPRPIAELLNPNLKDIRAIFENEFKGMTRVEILLENLLEARDELISTVRNSLTYTEKAFLLSVKQGRPDWSLSGLERLEHIESLPAVRWKLKNIQKMEKKKHRKAIAKLERYLSD
ncbi:MAG: nucleotidyl transferase AbiEii/AbiGii toxin family protein [Desulfobacteraceae bacterium]|nr:nucleotidyl transferase AbiEii/AbiGii toxin family protein [Desulfobacteraceae bacterium]